MAGRKMALTLDMPPFSRQLLHLRTIHSWVEICDTLELHTAIRECLLMDKSTEPLEFGGPDKAFAAWIIDMYTRILNKPILLKYTRVSHQVQRLRNPSDSSTIFFGDKSLSVFLFSTIGELDWSHRETLYMMCFATFNALVHRQAGSIPGTDHNITIAGAVATAAKLNVRLNME